MDGTSFLKEQGITSTPLRISIIEILQNASKPISYDEFLAKIKANKTTIYRNLDLLLSKNLIIKSEIEHKSFYELSGHAKAYFICETCHKMEEIEVPILPGKNIKSAVIKGVCENCK
ncbi:Fur family transcriptional regulator [Campylobacter hyointestinalis]|uniref:Fur family transcriptional regulator n=1 Tax=Campylobacter hyointestinalis TaxID=198 RepID=UPI0007288ADF|nr:transcriptional repressor [Campylobacter hyointestinalis]PPB68523.1 Fur family transcriptional regulator [Campylobacter hyointestinalis subsp. hyointestinalis]TWO22437.1 Fur family transcriptional regulator [Campylobacter hyointestinalis]CUU83927.1 zinc uptake regulation protein [Campylobacter hyointestinalis subsp. hyointestinalis]CUU87869.1 zinc uptake regulation protein [Campylobacter hyointestinalis subsp. hyointestinalis]